MKNLRLLFVGAGLVGLAMTTPANATPITTTEALYTATADPDDRWSKRSSCGRLVLSETFVWNGTSWREMTHRYSSNSAVSDDGDFVVTTPATPAAEGPTNAVSVPDSGGTTAALLFGALLGIVILRRHTIHAPGTTR